MKDITKQVAKIDAEIAALSERIIAKQTERETLITEATEMLRSLRSNYRAAPVPQPKVKQRFHPNPNPKRRGRPPGQTRMLTDDQVREIRKLGASGMAQVRIAEQFNQSQPQISLIIHRKIYGDVK
jgi:hypothetical protein